MCNHSLRHSVDGDWPTGWLSNSNSIHTINAGQKHNQVHGGMSWSAPIKLPEPFRSANKTLHTSSDGDHPVCWLITDIFICIIITSQKHGQKHSNMSRTAPKNFTKTLPDPHRSARDCLVGSFCTGMSFCKMNINLKMAWPGNVRCSAPNKLTRGRPVTQPTYTTFLYWEPSGWTVLYWCLKTAQKRGNVRRMSDGVLLMKLPNPHWSLKQTLKPSCNGIWPTARLENRIWRQYT